ncbi:MAG: hypothetical protein KatS3mg110_4463 [Pirellulaceae bacterium]|nr:MAG: hypothetical protein KatS3mg110_4463 [Pirellulaceae bacterium]
MMLGLGQNVPRACDAAESLAQRHHRIKCVALGGGESAIPLVEAVPTNRMASLDTPFDRQPGSHAWQHHMLGSRMAPSRSRVTIPVRPHQPLFAHIVACLAALTMPACAIPRLRYPDEGPAIPPSFAGLAEPDNSAHVPISDFFNDPALVDLIVQGLANNRELRILDEEVQVARNEILARQGAYLPFVNFGGEAGLEKPSPFTPLGAAEEQLEFLPGRHFPDPLGNFSLRANVFWALDIWRELRNARDAAIQRYLAATEQRNNFALRLVSEIAENYYELMSLDMQLQTLSTIIELQQQSYQLARASMESGRATALPVQRFLAEINKNQAEQSVVAQEAVQVENRINFLINRFPQPVARNSTVFLDLQLPKLAVGVPAQLLLNRPDIRQAERELEAAGLDVLVARAHFFPRLDVVASVGYQGFNPKFLFHPDALTFGVAEGVVAPLINWRAIQAEYQTANAKQLQAVYNYQRVILEAFTEVANRLAMVDYYTKSIESKKKQLQALELSVQTATNLFQNARVEYLEVLLAQRDLLEARRDLIQLKRQQLAATVNLYRALGGGSIISAVDQAVPEEVPAPEPR